MYIEVCVHYRFVSASLVVPSFCVQLTMPVSDSICTAGVQISHRSLSARRTFLWSMRAYYSEKTKTQKKI